MTGGVEEMKNEERKFLPVVALTAAVCVLLSFLLIRYTNYGHVRKDRILVGVVCDGDESTPYTANFYQAIRNVEAEYGDRVDFDVRTNIVQDPTYTGEGAMKDVIDELCEENCDLILTNSYGFGETAKEAAGKHPDIQFIQATCDNADDDPVFSNYHTFMGRIYEGRYIAGQVAGRKLAQLI
jgi:basic membrane lipoprotein Med (substrate-binding protein (PBP1-ABC) superfamily)